MKTKPCPVPWPECGESGDCSVCGGKGGVPVPFMTRARARYWRIARGYFGLGVALGIALGMVLGAASKVCGP